MYIEVPNNKRVRNMGEFIVLMLISVGLLLDFYFSGDWHR